jgi:hypothetical protein
MASIERLAAQPASPDDPMRRAGRDLEGQAGPRKDFAEQQGFDEPPRPAASGLCKRQNLVARRQCTTVIMCLGP